MRSRTHKERDRNRIFLRRARERASHINSRERKCPLRCRAEFVCPAGVNAKCTHTQDAERNSMPKLAPDNARSPAIMRRFTHKYVRLTVLILDLEIRVANCATPKTHAYVCVRCAGCTLHVASSHGSRLGLVRQTARQRQRRRRRRR